MLSAFFVIQSTHSVNLINIETGRSKQCHNCRMKTKQHSSIVCKQNGEVFNSIRRLAISIYRLDSYQTIRHGLQKKGSYHYHDLEYLYLYLLTYTPLWLETPLPHPSHTGFIRNSATNDRIRKRVCQLLSHTSGPLFCNPGNRKDN